MQELQVYTGGGPSSVATCRHGRFHQPGHQDRHVPGLRHGEPWASRRPTFYHQAQVEIGGSTPDRTFSYYVGLLGYNQDYRFIDNSNGAGYGTPGGIFSGNTDGFGIGYGFGSNQILERRSDLHRAGHVPGRQADLSARHRGNWKFGFPAQGCWQYYSGIGRQPVA